MVLVVSKPASLTRIIRKLRKLREIEHKYRVLVVDLDGVIESQARLIETQRKCMLVMNTCILELTETDPARVTRPA